MGGEPYNLLADGIVQVVRALSALDGRSAREWALRHGLESYFGSSVKGEAAIDWDKERERRSLLQQLVAGAVRGLDLARQALDEARRQRAISDVEALKPMYLREAGGGEEHQQFAEQQWSETFADRVTHRGLMLRGEVPWRHQELTVIGHERAREQLETMIDEVVTRLQQPLLEVGARLVRRYDSVATPSI